MRLKLQRKILATIISTLPVLAVGTESNHFIAESINFEGLEHLSSKVILDDVNIKPGDMITGNGTNNLISDLYRTGYFNDIQVYRKNDQLLIKVKERPIISKIEISGNDAVKTKDLKAGLTAAGLEVGNVYNPELIKQIRSSLEQEYYNLSKYAIKVDILTTSLSRNRVDVKINISEGKTAKIQKINLIGNKKFSEGKLIKQLTITTPSLWNLWGLITSDDEYSPQRMEASTEKLRSFYMDRGYIDFSVDSSQVSLTPSKEDTYVAFNISEGSVYKVTNVEVKGKFIVQKEKIISLLEIHKGDIFSRKKLLGTVNSIKSILGKKGYAFAQINPVPKINRKNKTVAITFYIDPGKKVYVNQINFKGNTVTNDNVYRREMLYTEGGAYNSYMIDQSKLRLQRLPYVENVSVQTVPVQGSDDMVDLDYNVKERSANSVTASLGYSQLYKFMVGGSLNMPNVIGTGNILNFSTQLSKPYKSLSASYTNPYFTDSGISQTIGAYITDVNTSGTTLTSYSTDSYGFTLNYGIPLSINNTMNAGIGYDHTKLVGGGGSEGSSVTVNNFIKQYGDTFNSYLINLGITRNTSNRAYFPNAGYIVDLGGQMTVPGSDMNWYKTHLKGSWFHSVTSFMTFSAKGGVEYGNGYGKNGELPFYQNYYGGGWGSVRGYTMGGMGPIDSLYGSSPGKYTEGSPLGGNLNVYANFDLLFPIPGMGDSSNMRWGGFFDMGNTYSTYQSSVYGVNNPKTAVPTEWQKTPRYPSFSNLRYSVGLEFQWASPMGPLAFSIAKPLNAKPGDETQFFQFSLGQTF